MFVDFSYPATVAKLWRESSFDIQATGLRGNAPTCAVVDGTLPTGLVLSPQGCRVAGRPSEVRAANVTIRLTVPGFAGQVDKQIRFESVGPGLYYALPFTERRGARISVLPTAIANDPIWVWTPIAGETVSYSLASGALPSGLSLDKTTGEVHGILTQTAVREFAIGATVSGPLGTYTVVSQAYTLTTVLEGLQFFYGANDFPVTARVGDSLDLPPLFNFGFYLNPAQYTFGEYRLASTSQPLPAGLFLDSTTGHIFGVPTSTGTFDLYFEVDLNSQGQSAVYPTSVLHLTIAP